MTLHKLLPGMSLGVLCLLLGGCASAGGNSGNQDGGSSAVPAPSSSADATATPQAQDNDLLDEHPLTWTNAAAESDQQLRVSYLGGNPACYGVRAEMNEISGEVIVNLFEGTRRTAPETCTTVAVEGFLVLDLNAPLGEREVRSTNGGS